jgi:release factor glutamine methyltransferase
MSQFEIRNVLREAAAELTGSSSPRLDAEILLAYSLNLERSDLLCSFKRTVSAVELNCFRELLDRRKKGEPIAYITGRKEFWSLTFTVNRDVLIPRPETEFLVEETARLCGSQTGNRILEIGTGSGAISIALAAPLSQPYITATDISEEALAIAIQNAESHKVSDRIRFLKGNLFEPVQGRFDVIVSNPPYISECEYKMLGIGVREFEPACALLAGPDGTEFHQQLIEGSRDRLESGGWILMEFGAGQEDRITAMLEQSRFREIELIKDYAGFFRMVKAKGE